MFKPYELAYANRTYVHWLCPAYDTHGTVDNFFMSNIRTYVLCKMTKKVIKKFLINNLLYDIIKTQRKKYRPLKEGVKRHNDD